jgi:hypothetical protein
MDRGQRSAAIVAQRARLSTDGWFVETYLEIALTFSPILTKSECAFQLTSSNWGRGGSTRCSFRKSMPK